MNKKKVFLLLFFAMLLLALGASFYWHQFAIKRPVLEKSLASYDNQVYLGQEACLSVNYNARNIAGESMGAVRSGKNERLIVTANGAIFFDEKIGLMQTETISTCIPANGLVEGENLIEVFFGKERLFFNATKTASAPNTGEASEIRLISTNGNNLVFEATNNSAKGGVYPLAIMLNGELQREILVESMPRETKQIEATLDLQNGDNLLSLNFLDAEKSETIAHEKKEPIPAIMGLIALVLVLGFVLVFFLLKYPFFNAMAYAFASLFSALIAIPWALNIAGIELNFYTIFLSLLVFCFAVYLFLNRKKPVIETSENGDIKKFMLYFAIFALALISINMILPSHFNNWNVFYERYAGMVIENGAVPLEDPLGYLGRGFTFMWGYFLFNSSLAFTTGFEGNLLFALVSFLCNSFFLFSVIYFAKSFGFKLNRSLLYLLLLLSSLFIFTTLVNSPKHILSFSFFFLAVAMFLRKKNPIATGIFVGIAASTQASFLFLFPITCLITSKKIEWKPLLTTLAVSAAVFAVLFSPIFMNFGSGNEIYSEEWGYLIKHFPFDFALDLGQVVPILFLAVLVKIGTGWKEQGFFTKKLFSASIILLLFEIFVSYRINIITHTVLVLLLLTIFHKRFSERYFSMMIAVLALLSIMANLVIVSYSNMPPALENSASFLDHSTASGEVVVSDPYYAHVVTYFGKRKVLADLYVEYAVEEKLDDEYDLILNENREIIDKYNVGYVFVDKEKIFVTAGDLHYFPEEKEFSFMDKVYVNESFSIHRARE